MLRRRIKKYLTACISLIILGTVICVAPMGRSDSHTGNSCGPKAVAALIKEVSSEPLDSYATPEQVKAKLGSWDYISENMPFIGGATLPWGIKHALEQEGLSSEVRVGPRELCLQQYPFIALILQSETNWHYVVVLEVRDNTTILTSDGTIDSDEFLKKWRWSWYWGCHIVNKEVSIK